MSTETRTAVGTTRLRRGVRRGVRRPDGTRWRVHVLGHGTAVRHPAPSASYSIAGAHLFSRPATQFAAAAASRSGPGRRSRPCRRAGRGEDLGAHALGDVQGPAQLPVSRSAAAPVASSSSMPSLRPGKARARTRPAASSSQAQAYSHSPAAARPARRPRPGWRTAAASLGGAHSGRA